MRIGHGYDAHRLVAGRALYIGGIEIPYEKGLLGHSDADVLLHALMDAILGAAALGDIGKHFPPSDMHYRGIRSTCLLKRVMELIGETGYKICNVDMTVIAQKPKLSPYIESMRQCIAEHLQVGSDAVSVKATTTEGMGFTGREEGIAAVAVCLLDQK